MGVHISSAHDLTYENWLSQIDGSKNNGHASNCNT